MSQRRSGILVPLFSLRSSRSWGIGEFLDLPPFAKWLQAAGQALVQILPITEIAEHETSPYSGLTAMALDPAYISLPSLIDFEASGGVAELPSADHELLEEVRRSPRVQHRQVRSLKQRALRQAYAHFTSRRASHDDRRDQALQQFVRDHAGWLAPYTLFQVLHGRYEEAWWKWPAALARGDEPALENARTELREEIAYREYVQWTAAVQWQAARQQALPTRVFGDVPFMVSGDSPDVWSRQGEFRFDATVGVPPDAFSATGQDWGLPPWRSEVMAGNDFAWMRARGVRAAELFDGFRLDHLVGLYRLYMRPLDRTREPWFTPPDVPSQERLGERLVTLYLTTGAEVIAEDLGTVPDFVRASLERLRVPGCKVMRWEREWSQPGQPYVDPGEFDVRSFATTGTHDTEPLAAWWQTQSEDDQQQVLQLPSVRRYMADGSEGLDAIIRGLLDAPSKLAIIPLQDVFHWTDRINTPAVVNEENWSWTLPWPVDHLLELPAPRAAAERLAAWAQAADRSSAL